MGVNVGGSKIGNIVTNNLLMYANAGSAYSYRPSPNQATWKDLSGNNNNLTIGGNTTVSSLYGGGLIQGASGNVAVSPTINLSANYSISFWVKTGSPAGTSNIVTLGADHKFFHSSGGGGGLWYAWSLYNWQNIAGATNALYYITGTYNNTNKNFTMYNGTSLIGTSDGSGFSATAAGNVALTLTGYQNIEFYSVKLYSSVLSLADVTQNYNATRTRFGV